MTTATDEEMAELRAVCPDAKIMSDGPQRSYISLPKLVVPTGGRELTLDALVSRQEHSGYPTRLFLSQPIPEKATNWTQHQILGRNWHTWSYRGIEAHLRPAEILAAHMRALL